MTKHKKKPASGEPLEMENLENLKKLVQAIENQLTGGYIFRDSRYRLGQCSCPCAVKKNDKIAAEVSVTRQTGVRFPCREGLSAPQLLHSRSDSQKTCCNVRRSSNVTLSQT